MNYGNILISFTFSSRKYFLNFHQTNLLKFVKRNHHLHTKSCLQFPREKPKLKKETHRIPVWKERGEIFQPKGIQTERKFAIKYIRKKSITTLQKIHP